jgi:hypothetical protein
MGRFTKTKHEGKMAGESVSQAGFIGTPQRGFAALMPKTRSYEIPRMHSFAEAERIGLEQSATKSTPAQTTPRAKRRNAPKQRRDYHPWPEMAVVSTLDPKGAKAWRKYGQTVEASTRGVGRYVGTESLRFEIITSRELHAAMNERFDGTARKPHDSARRSRARNVVRTINGIINRLQQEERQASIARELIEDPDLLERSLDPDNPKWLGELAMSIDSGEYEPPIDLPTRLWTPASFVVGPQEGAGEQGIGLALRETDLYTKRAQLIGALCSSGELGFNPIHFKNPAGNVLKLVDTAPLPAAGLVYDLPSRGRPSDFAAMPPRAHMTNL